MFLHRKMLNLVLLFLATSSSVESWMFNRQIVSPVGVDRSSAVSINQPARASPPISDSFQSLANLTANSRISPTYPIDCFYQSEIELSVAIPSDCEFVINEMVLRLPNPMQEQTFGFNKSADLDLSSPEDRRWYFKQCVVTLDSHDRTEQDTFRPVDVAFVAQRILDRCVVESKHALGGTAGIGSILKNFYVSLGGLPPLTRTSRARPSLPPSNVLKRSISAEDTHTKSVGKRSSDLLDLIDLKDFTLPFSCVKPGMPADAGKINVDDCVIAAKTMLHDPRILDQQLFTTEPTGGIHVPLIQQAKGCYLMVNTHAHLSSSETFSLLKAVYYASGVMRKCPLGGVAKLSGQSGFFVSVTSVDPAAPKESGLASLLNGTISSGLLATS